MRNRIEVGAVLRHPAHKRNDWHDAMVVGTDGPSRVFITRPFAGVWYVYNIRRAHLRGCERIA